MKYDLENINARFGIGSQKWQEMKNNPLVDEKVIPFSVADMEFKLAPEITEGLKTFIDDNILGYAGTNKKYRESVCKWQQKHHDFTVDEKWLVETHSVLNSFFTAVKAFTQKGDGVMLFTPVYYPMYKAIEINQRKLVEIPLINNGMTYDIDWDLFTKKAKAIDTGDTAWVLISAALVFIMTPGLAFFYGGMVRSKNVLSTIMHSFFIVAMISVEWVLIGYAMTFGSDIGGFIGSLDKVGLTGVGMQVMANGTIPELAFVAFQCMFAIITPALITGAFAERMKFGAFVVFILLWAILIYNPMAHWVWGGGFLAKLGALDFAGGLVIHILSGVSGLTVCILLGKRHGYGKVPMLPHHLPMTVLGATLLWFGWFGFNAGSALGANALAANAFITTQAAAAMATVSWVACEWMHHGKPTILGAASGCVAGLVAITPAAGFVAPLPAVIIGLIGGIVCYFAVAVVKEKFGYDLSLFAGF